MQTISGESPGWVDTHAARSKSEARGACSAAIRRRLGNHVNKSTPRGQDDFSLALWRLQRTMWAVTDFKRLAGCHRWLAKGAGGAVIQWKPGSARWGGLQTSASVWASPVASLRISRVRADDVAHAVENWKKADEAHSVEFLTLTVRHTKKQTLSEVWDAVSAGWRGITQGGSWRGTARYEGDKKRYGIEHFCRSVEVTLGKNGWHVHAHVLLFLKSKLSLDERETLEDRLFSRWSAAIGRAGYSVPNRQRGIKIEEAVKHQDASAMGAYMAKGSVRSIGDEISRGQQKKGRVKKSRTPFQILADIATARENQNDYSADLKFWREWEKDSLGRRQMTWSRGAKKELGVFDLDDAAALAFDDEKNEVDSYSVAVVTAENWKKPIPGIKTRLSDDTDVRCFILDEVKRAKTPVQAQEKAKKILRLLKIPMVFPEKPIPLSRLEKSVLPVQVDQAREVLTFVVDDLKSRDDSLELPLPSLVSEHVVEKLLV